ncbi:MAG: pyridoxal phosphate-dependent aminotransferase [Candidatus Woesearchaeota archaeon]
MKNIISERISRIEESPTLAISGKAKEMKAQGINVIDFGAGQLDFEIPEEMKQSAIAALNTKGIGKYTPVPGSPAMKDALIKMFKKEFGLEYTPAQVMVGCGGKHTIYNLMMATINKGDEVIIPKPYWVSYPDIVSLAQGVPVFVETDDKFHIKADAIKEKITDKTKWIIINSPSNPSGAVIEEEELKKVADLAVEKGIMVMSDEVYAKLIYDKKHISIASLNEGIKKLTVITSAFSKTYGIPGWRLGYLAGDAEIIKACNKLQSQSTSNPSSIVQQTMVNMLDKDHGFLKKWMDDLKRKRDFVVKRLNEMEGVTCPVPEGAFYAFPKIPVKDDAKFAKELLEEAYVAVIPGEPFGSPGHIRISFGGTDENLAAGMDRIEEFLNSIKEDSGEESEDDPELKADLDAIRKLGRS